MSDPGHGDEIERLLRTHWEGPPPPSAALRARVLALAVEPRPARRPRRWILRATALGCAAAALMLLWRRAPHRALSVDDEASLALPLGGDEDDYTDETRLYEVAEAAALAPATE